MSFQVMDNDPSNELTIEDKDLIEDTYIGDQSLLEQTIDSNYGDDDVGLMLDGIHNTLAEFDIDADDTNVNGKDYQWKIIDDELCNNVTMDYVSNRNVNKAKDLCNLTLQKVHNELRIPRTTNANGENNNKLLGVDDCINFL
jgi:hypothetical protein